MLFPLGPLAIGVAILANAPAAFALSADALHDRSIDQLIKDANIALASGQTQDAFTYFDAAITRDPNDYLNLFKRGAAYLSLGKAAQAQRDFDKALDIHPTFEGALVQRAKLRSRKADWVGARKDYEAAGKRDEIAQLEEAQGAAVLAREAAEKGDWEGCVTQAGAAIIVAGAAYDIRKIRARCRFERGEVMEGVSDLQHLLRIAPGNAEPNLEISAMTFYSLGETDKGLEAINKCLRSDPDHKACKTLKKMERATDRQVKKAKQLFEKRQFIGTAKLLVPRSDEPGLLQGVKDDVKYLSEQGYIHPNAPNGLYSSLVDMTCEAYVESNSQKKGAPYCAEALKLNPTSLYGLLNEGQTQLDADHFESAIRTLETAKEHHPQHNKIHELLQKAHTLLKRSKQKDYYKVLGVDRDADERQIKSAYRKLSKQYHPDKAAKQGITAEQAQSKMAAINEAYEVLSDAELKQRFDNGDDPNNPEQQGNPFQQGAPFGSGQGGQQFFFRQGPGQGFPGGGGSFKFQQGGGGFQFPGGFGFP